MTHENFAFVAAWVISVAFLIGGCGNNQKQPSLQSASDELPTLTRLEIGANDSLLFTQAEAPDENPNLSGILERDPVEAYSFIEISTPLSTIGSYQPGTLIHLSLDKNLVITARVNRNQSIGDHITTLTGSLIDPYSGNLILSIAEERITGSIDLISENRLFYIRYNRESGQHYLAEINRTKLDTLEGSEPLEY